MVNQRRTGLSGIVLAGGQSQRIGHNKALMKLGGQILISRVLDRLSHVCDELIISSNDVDLYSGMAALVVPDVIRGHGALGGIHAGLVAMRNEQALIVACDMPFLNVPLLRFMATVAPGFDVVVPRLGEDYEPLHAIYSTNCIAPIERLLADGPQRIVSFYSEVRVREIVNAEVRLLDADLSFFNINTQADWIEAQRLCALGF